MNDQPPRYLCLWPGLAGLWMKGNGSSLVIAIGFSLLLNLALLSTFVWPAIVEPGWKVLLWPCVFAVWLVGGWVSWRFLDRWQRNDLQNTPENADKTDDTLFVQAQTEYLKGEFTKAERLLRQRLENDRRDAEARLLLATIYRRTQRGALCRQQLEQLQRIDDGRRWRFEIERESRLITEPIDQSQEQSLQDEDTSEIRDSGTIQLGQAVGHSDVPDHDEKQPPDSTFDQQAA